MTSKFLKIAVALVLFAAAIAGLWYFLAITDMASAYYAKRVCSGVFVSGRDARDVLKEDVRADMPGAFRKLSARIDRGQGIVTASLFGLAEKRALYREGLGCTLVNGIAVEELRAQAQGFTSIREARDEATLWPEGSRVDTTDLAPDVEASLRVVLDTAFAEPDKDALRRTRAVVIVWRGRIVAERYAQGFGPHVPQAGWSLGKSIAGALTGILVGEGRMTMETAKLFPEWQQPDDPRSRITLDHLLRMTSGLDFDDPQGGLLTDVRTMLFLESDAAAYAVAQPAASAPGESWIYGSGSSLIVSRLWREALGGSLAEQFAFPRRVLFDPLGMSSAVLEPDASGTFLAAAFAHASARDWARFGLFLLQDGVWQGRRILPEGWMANSLEPRPQSKGVYAAHFWRRVPDFLRPASAPDRALPEDRFYMLGHDGQMVAVMPSRELVIVRLGLSRRRDAWDPDALVADVLEALPGGD